MILLSIQTDGLQMNAALRPEALTELIALAQRYRTESDPATSAGGSRFDHRRYGPRLPQKTERPLSSAPAALSEQAEAVKAGMKAVAWDTITKLLPTCRFGDKMLLLAAWIEARQVSAVHKLQLSEHYARSGQEPAANPGRDLRNLFQEGFLQPSAHPKALRVSEAGWSRVRHLIGDDGFPDATVPA